VQKEGGCGGDPPPQTDEAATKQLQQMRIGRKLLAARQAWERIGATDALLKGARAEWKDPSTLQELHNRPWPPPFKGTPLQQHAYEEELRKELAEDIVEPTTRDRVRWLNPTFLIEKRPGEWRKILNCVVLNAFIRDKRVKMEHVEAICAMSCGGEWATTLDIKSAYSHVLVDDELKPYLCFQYGDSYYRYRTMPFGLKNAPRTFVKLMRPVAQWIREQMRTRLGIYMDDLLVMAETAEESRRKTAAVQDLLLNLGWTLSLEKCHLTPMQTVKFLGWELHFDTRMLRMTTKRRTELLRALFEMEALAENRMAVRCRQLASLLGSLNFLRIQFPMASLYLTKLSATKTRGVRRSGWDGSTTLTPMIAGELKWWIRSISCNSPHSWKQMAADAVLTTDASPWGWGATLDRPGSDRIHMWGLWTTNQKRMTSNHKELEAIRLGLRDATRWLSSGSDIVVRSDNTAAVFAVQKWRAKQRRLETLRKMAKLMSNAKIRVTATYIPGVQNGAADRLSRMGESFDFKMTPATWSKVKTLTRQLTLDVFASRASACLPRYCSMDRSDEGAVAVDGLSVNWRDEVVLLHPPPTLIMQTIQKAIAEQATGVLIVPDWRGQTWSPLLAQLSETQTTLGPYLTTMIRTEAMERKGWLLPPGNVIAHTMGTRMTSVRSFSTSSPEHAGCP
jgi:ribonuclease HI